MSKVLDDLYWKAGGGEVPEVRNSDGDGRHEIHHQSAHGAMGVPARSETQSKAVRKWMIERRWRRNI